MKTPIVVLLPLCLGGCERVLGAVLGDSLSQPEIGISVERAKDSYVFRMRNCANQSRPLEIEEIRVIPDVPRDQIDRASPVCLVEIEPGQRDAKLTFWRYGDVPRGYVKRVCQDLAPGGTYQVRLGGMGHMKFALGPDGSIKETSPMCE